MGYMEEQEIFVAINSKVKYHNQPCGMILADRMDLAIATAKKVKIIYAKSMFESYADCQINLK